MFSVNEQDSGGFKIRQSQQSSSLELLKASQQYMYACSAIRSQLTNSFFSQVASISLSLLNFERRWNLICVI